MTDTALYFTAPETVEVRETAVGPPAADELLVDTRASAISAGTELLVYRDQTPADLPADETLDALDGDLSYPLRYGYAASGVVREVGSDVDPNWVGRSVFSFVPHQTSFCATPDSVVALPPETTPAAGSLLPSVETATNIVLDAAPRLGERVVVFGAGVIGLCVTRLLAAFPLESLVVVDPIERRRALAAEFGADRTTTPTELGDADPAGADLAVDGADLAIELSGQPSALDDAIGVVGYDARIVVGSWYGTKREPIDLGGRFHRNRIDIVSSQVSTISPELRGRWDRDRRMDAALDRLDWIPADELITHRIPFERAPEAYELLDSAPDDAVQVILEYE
ncbi:zinc-dependent alcohol dehydrogenase [Halorubrum lacusprofundi]|jgi:2-desacetyl-2-hydroxyethyl bacteriochlorophyllide A dehydrogenase|uniref:Alcohol dehydrogenase zinc-binding domain protein n=1 Tax=Halorubrum lacusprofundi (strain ATCC 49239 / DSM 5036 / JCM 8891 / ACAM 34) TaxID=416348 RepID=B9LTJ0_HALLT|nr:zinc-binding alcohol dehydrogenase [Halorubrum lacusprofundi]ACM56124.1 Alcohol dehydrogenase zinc-binding domain protein [Halorubrum lacusprofundi ATCC 49239]MCG1005565.1 zinc-binding alcohol dehydrogenase [Halorubrum lacusprofundi]